MKTFKSFVSELSKKTLKSYLDKAGNRIRKHSSSASLDINDILNTDDPRKQKELKKSAKRSARKAQNTVIGISRAAKRLAK